MFEGLLPSNLSIYAVTASNAVENSWGTYCPGHYPYPPPDYDTCLGDLFSISWMEDRFYIYIYQSFVPLLQIYLTFFFFFFLTFNFYTVTCMIYARKL